MNFESLKITAPIAFNQRFESGTLESESQCSSTAPSWDLYLKSGDNVVNAKGRANEMGQSWCPTDLLDFQLPTTGTSQRRHIDPMQTHVAIGPATRCDAAHLRWDVLKLLRCMKIVCNALRCKFQHVQYFAPDFGVAQPFIIQFSNGFQHCDEDLMSILVICVAKSSVNYF